MTDVESNSQHRVAEEVINYRNRMDSFISSFITIPPVTLLKKKHLEFRRECLNRLMKSPGGDHINVIWELERHIFLYYQMMEDSYEVFRSCHSSSRHHHLNVPVTQTSCNASHVYPMPRTSKQRI